MANWCYNTYVVKSTTKNVLNFVNEGLKNKGLEPRENVKEAIKTLWSSNGVSMATFRPIPETFLKYDTTNKKHLRDSLDYETKEPLFKTDEEYEIYCKEYDDAANYQKETYGVVGWKDYNCRIGFGCKWNTEVELTNFEIDEEKGITTLYMSGETPWYYPVFWLKYIKNTFNLWVFICSHEESDFFHFYGEIDGDFIEYYDFSTLEELYPKESDYNDKNEYYEAIRNFEDNLWINMSKNFTSYVDNYGETDS